MKPAFHYIVRAKLIRFVNKDKIDFIDFEETFIEESPIKARNKAFQFYQNFIEILLEAKNEAYYSDKQARLKLLSFYDTDELSDVKFGSHEIDLKDSMNLGFGVFMHINDFTPDDFNIVLQGIDLSTIRSDEIFIHGIGNIHYNANDPEALIHYYLTEELEYYEYFKYSTEDQIIDVTFFSREEWREGYGEDQPDTIRVLKTPFDWTGYDKAFWWGEEEQLITIPTLKNKSIEEIIALGESNQIEFKPALLYNFSTQKAGIGIKSIIAKTICSFLNSNGGYLFIGVKDDGSIQGLDYDFSLAVDKEKKDFFRLEFDQMIKHFLTFVIMSNITGDFYEIQGKTIFVVAVNPSVFRPVFMKGQNGKEFYVRGEASSRKLEDIEEIANYCLNKWGNL